MGGGGGGVENLYVKHAERENEYGILFIFSLLCVHIHLEYVRIHVIYRVNQAEYVIHILVVASQEYVNIYSTRRVEEGQPLDLRGSGPRGLGVRVGGIYLSIYLSIYLI